MNFEKLLTQASKIVGTLSVFDFSSSDLEKALDEKLKNLDFINEPDSSYISISSSRFVNEISEGYVGEDLISVSLDFLADESIKIWNDLEIKRIILKFEIDVREGYSRVTNEAMLGVLKTGRQELQISAELEKLEFSLSLQPAETSPGEVFKEFVETDDEFVFPEELSGLKLAQLSISLNAKTGRVEFHMAVDDVLEVGMFKINHVQLGIEHWYGATRFQFIGSFNLAAVKVRVEAEIKSNVWHISGETREPIPLKALLAELGAEAIGLHDLNIIQLRMGVAKFDDQIEYNFSLALDGDWQITSGLRLKSLSMDVERKVIGRGGFATTYTFFRVRGSVDVGGVLTFLSASTRNGDWLLEGCIAGPINLGSATSAFLGNSRSDLPPLEDKESENHLATVDELAFRCRDDASEYEFNVAVSDISFTFFKEIKIQSARLHWKKSGQELKRELAATWQIDDCATMQFTALGSNNGWLFSGRCPDPVPFSTVLSDEVMGAIGNFGIDVHEKDAGFSDLSASYNTQNKDFNLAGGVSFKIAGKPTELSLHIATTHSAEGGASQSYSGRLKIGDLYFDALFEDTKKDDSDLHDQALLAAYHSDIEKPIDLSSLLSPFFPGFPSINLALNDAFYYRVSSGSGQEEQSKQLFVCHIGSGIDLSNLPLVGKSFPSGQSVHLNYQIIVPSGEFSSEEVVAINGKLPPGLHHIETESLTQSGSDTGGIIAGKPLLATSLKLGEETIELNLPLDVNTSDPASGPVKEDDSGEQEGSQWVPVGKRFGPVYFRQIKGSYTDGKLGILLDVSLAVGDLVISLDGLGLKTPLTELVPEFELNGLGLNYRNPNVRVGGTLLRKEISIKGQTRFEYSGLAMIKATGLSLTAIGSYTNFSIGENEEVVDNQPSLFVYGVLDKILGGPPFFFVTGLAVGFGYNRKLVLPEIDEVPSFPLIEVARNPKPLPSADKRQELLSETLDSLDEWLQPSAGDMFFVVGVKFNSFRLANTIALLILSHGDQDEITILGETVIKIPPDKPGAPRKKAPLVQLVIASKAGYSPQKGLLAVDAVIESDKSFILSRDCKLSGGFSSRQWFSGEHSGDFVITLGGYHPSFRPPSHYPTVPRLSFNWQLDRHTNISGNAYFALCSHAAMAGGYLETIYESGHFKAWFRIGADFIIMWEPYHYEASIHAEIGASYTYKFFGTHHINVRVGAALSLWGPNFGGKAKVDLYVTSITMKFGDSSSKKPKALAWGQFKTAFLPGDDKVCSISISEGLVQASGRKSEGALESHEVVNPKDLRIIVDSAIPVKSSTVLGTSQAYASDFGIAPMANGKDDVKSEMTVIINHVKEDGDQSVDNFSVSTLEKKVPVALWGTRFKAETNPDEPLLNAVTGFAITPDELFETKKEIDVKKPSETSVSLAFGLNPAEWPQAYTGNTIREVRDPQSDNPKELLKNLGLDFPMDINSSDPLMGDYKFELQPEAVA